MSRDYVRSLKRSLRASTRLSVCEASKRLTQESALSLLERSMKMRHKRLAVIRLEAAVRFDSSVPEECWQYCSQIAEESANGELKHLFARIVLEAKRRSDLQLASGVCVPTGVA